jgi:hypothetical protein
MLTFEQGYIKDGQPNIPQKDLARFLDWLEEAVLAEERRGNATFTLDNFVGCVQDANNAFIRPDGVITAPELHFIISSWAEWVLASEGVTP